MTEAQNSFYLRRWGVVARLNGWRMVSRRFNPEAIIDASGPHAAVWQAACSLAAAEARGVTPNDMRHGCHVVALGRDKSHLNFTNKEFDAVLNYWGDERRVVGLLIEPLDLGSGIHRDHPEMKVRERQLHFLREDCLAGYVTSESMRIFGTKAWETLNDEKLCQLHDHIRARPKARKQSVLAGERVLDPEIEPW